MEQGYIKRVITFYVATNVGEKFLDKEQCEFKALKGEDGFVVENVDEKIEK